MVSPIVTMRLSRARGLQTLTAQMGRSCVVGVGRGRERVRELHDWRFDASSRTESRDLPWTTKPIWEVRCRCEDSRRESEIHIKQWPHFGHMFSAVEDLLKCSVAAT